MGLICLLLGTLLASPVAPAPDSGLARYQYTELAMGVAVRIVLFAPDEARARAACRAAFDRLAEVEQVASDYRPTSELNRLVAHPPGTPVPLSDDLWALLERSQALAAQTAGAFDITIGPLVQLWREARRTGQRPAPQALAAASARCGWQHLRLDPSARTATCDRPDLQLDLGGIAKGYGADQALAVLRAAGLDRALLQAGGEIVVGAPPPGLTGWRLALPAPSGADPVVIALRDGALSISGDTAQFVELDGVRYSHVIDPRTGLGLTHRAQTIVIAADGLTADSLATAAGVLGPGAGQALLDASGVVGWLTLAD